MPAIETRLIFLAILFQVFPANLDIDILDASLQMAQKTLEVICTGVSVSIFPGSVICNLVTIAMPGNAGINAKFVSH